MHTKTQGGLGVSKVLSFLISNSIPCFTEAFCDLSKSDIIAETKMGLKRIQVRSTRSKTNTVELSLRSITPGTRSKPCIVSRISQVDIFALYVIDKDIIIFIDSGEIKNKKARISFNINPNKKRLSSTRSHLNYSKPSFLKKGK